MLKNRGWGETSAWVRAGIIAWSILGIVIISAGVMWVVGRLWAAVVPLAVGSLIVFLLKTPVAWMVKKGLSRTLATIIAFVAFLAVLGLLGFIILPALGGQFAQFVDAFPVFYEEAQSFFADVHVRYEGLLLPEWVGQAVDSAQESITSSLAGISRSIASGILSAGGSIVTFFGSLFMGFIVGFYLLVSLPKVGRGVLRVFPPDSRADVVALGGRINEVVGGFIRGQSLIALIVGVVTGIAMYIIGVPYAAMIGFIAGITNVIPYLGPVVGGFVAAVVALFVDPTLMLWAIVAVIVIQQLESTFLSPKIMSDQVGLHPVIVILSLIAGASLAGLLGMLLAVPVAGTIKAIWSFYAEKNGWSEDDVLIAPPVDDSVEPEMAEESQ